MLGLKFNISVEHDASSMIFEDVTGNYSQENPTGYGGPNTPMSSILHTKLHVKFPGGAKYVLYSNYLPSMGKWRIPATLFSDLNKVGSPCYTPKKNCGCTVSQSFISDVPFDWGYGNDVYYVNYDCERKNTFVKFPDGCYEFRYEVYATENVGATLCDYYVKTVICDGQILQVKQNGGWVDVTGDSDIQHGNITYSIKESSLEITEWRVLDGDMEVKKGPLSGFNCKVGGEVPEDAFEEPVIAASKTILSPFYANTVAKINEKAFLVTVGSCDVIESISGKPIDIFSLAHARYQAIKNNPHCGCNCIDDNLKAINILLDSINGDS